MPPTCNPGMTGWQAYVAGVVWALEQAGHRIGGADLVLTSDVPVGAGSVLLGSSGVRGAHRAGRPQPTSTSPVWSAPSWQDAQRTPSSGHRPA